VIAFAVDTERVSIIGVFYGGQGFAAQVAVHRHMAVVGQPGFHRRAFGGQVATSGGDVDAGHGSGRRRTVAGIGGANFFRHLAQRPPETPLADFPNAGFGAGEGGGGIRVMLGMEQASVEEGGVRSAGGRSRLRG